MDDGTDNRNVAIGFEAMNKSVGGFSTAIGYQSLLNNIDGFDFYKLLRLLHLF